MNNSVELLQLQELYYQELPIIPLKYIKDYYKLLPLTQLLQKMI